MKLSRLVRNRLIGAARRASGPLAELRARNGRPVIPLEAVSRRLELLLAAMYGRPMRIASSRDKGEGVVVLPARLEAPDGEAMAMARYRLMAIEQGARLARGTRAFTPPDDPLVYDLFIVAEGASVDADIALRAPGLVTLLEKNRRADLARRPSARGLPPLERAAELVLQQHLATNEMAPGLARTASPEQSLAWAEELAARLRAECGPQSRPYRRLHVVGSWAGPRESWRRRKDELEPLPVLSDIRTATVTTTHDVGKPAPQSSTAPPAGDDAPSSVSESPNGPAADEEGGQRPDAGEAHDGARAAGESAALPDQAGISYPEWDTWIGAHRPAAATVIPSLAAEGDERWALDTLHEHAPLVRQIRHRFEPLRARRLRLRAQRSGEDLDLDACVSAIVDARLGRSPSDRLYLHARQSRGALAIALLVDVSGSTKSLVLDGRTVMEVERLTLLLASEALDALDDAYMIAAFSGTGRHGVEVQTVKGFGEHDRGVVRRRIAALAPRQHTRLGAAVRHTAALLRAQPAERRVLLILSDGKPNDVDGYQGDYGLEDSRQAILEARAKGAHVFALTVDSEESEYLPHLFGPGGYLMLRAPAQLPAALLRVVDRLVRK